MEGSPADPSNSDLLSVKPKPDEEAKEEIDKYFDYYKIFSIMYSNAQSLNGVYSFISYANLAFK